MSQGNRRAASIRALMEIKDVDQTLAATVRAAWRAPSRAALQMVAGLPLRHLTERMNPRKEVVNALIGASGVEYLGRLKSTGDHVHYCNGGDTYATTVIFVGTELRVGCIGDFMESGRLIKPVQL